MTEVERRTSGWDSRPHADLWVGLPHLRVGLLNPSRLPGGLPDPSRISGWASRPLLDLWVGLPTHPRPPGGPTDPSWTFGWACRTLGGPLDPSRTSGWSYRPHADLLSTFCTSEGQSINFLCISRTFHQRLSTFRAAVGTSINFLYIRGTFRQLFLCPLDLSSTFVNFPCI